MTTTAYPGLAPLSPAALIGLVLALSACAGEGTPDALGEWEIGTTPTLTLGGSTQTEFTRVTGAWRLSSGATAVVDGGSSEIRVFDARGAFVHAFGRVGDGPGEFRQMAWAGHVGDTAVVYDGAHHRLTTSLLDTAPRLLSTLSVVIEDGRGGDFIVAGRLSDGRWLLHAMSFPDVNVRGFQRMRGFVGLLGATKSVQWLAEVPDMALFVDNPSGSQKMVRVTPAVFPPSLSMAASGSSVWFGDTATDTIVHVDVATGVRNTLKLPDPPPSVTREVVDSARTRDLAEVRDSAAREQIEASYSETNLPTHLPAFQEIVPGPDDELWVQSPAASRDAPARYVVFARSGSQIARVSVAAGFRVTDIGRDYVLGVHRDDDGVETVRVYALRH